MFREIVILSDTFRLEALVALAEQLDWELDQIYPPRASSHAGRIWTTPDDVRVHYIEDARFYVRYIILQDGVSKAIEHKIFASLRQLLPTLEPDALFETIEHAEHTLPRLEALHKTSALVSPEDSDPAYMELLRRLLLDQDEPLSMRLAALQLCEHLSWPQLGDHVHTLAAMDWPGQSMAQRVLDTLQ